MSEYEGTGEWRQLAQMASDAARHKWARFKDRGTFPAMIDAAQQASDRLGNEITRQDNLFAGRVLDACLEMFQQPQTKCGLVKSREGYGRQFEIADFDGSARKIALRSENPDGIFRQLYPDVDTLFEDVNFKVEVDYHEGVEGDLAMAKEPRQLLNDLKSGDAAGVAVVKITFGFFQSVSPVPEKMRGSEITGLDLYNKDEILIRPLPPRFRKSKDAILYRVEVKEEDGYFGSRSFTPYGYKNQGIFLQTRKENDREVVVVEEPQLPTVRVENPIKGIIADAKKAGMMDHDEFEKRYGSGNDDPVSSALWKFQRKAVVEANERLALLYHVDSLIQQVKYRIINGPQNLV